jgi:hypothetical protein
MSGTALTITIAVALLALFLISITIFKFAVKNTFTRTRFMMSTLFIFIVLTLSISFWPYAYLTLPYAIPALIVGMILGYAIGVRTARQKLMMQGIERYMERFAIIEHSDVKNLNWWSLVNFYSIMSGLILINLVGFTNVILKGNSTFIIFTSIVGAALIGSIIPYLAHLWTFPLTHRGK